MHICISKVAIIGSNNDLLPGQHQAIILTNVWMLLISPLGTNFSEILIEIYNFLSKKFIRKCCQKIGGHFVSASMYQI